MIPQCGLASAHGRASHGSVRVTNDSGPARTLRGEVGVTEILPCNAPGCRAKDGGFLCRKHSEMIPNELKKATRRLYRVWLRQPKHKRRPIATIFLFAAALHCIRERQKVVR